jgi:DNA-binding transcriptional LysR family regulator
MGGAVQWNDLQFFLAVCEKGTVAGAARWLQVNHSTVLRRIGSLEQALDGALFDRLPAGYSLTPMGSQLHAALAGVAEQIEGAQRRLHPGDASMRGTVRLTTSDTLMRSGVSSALNELRALHPAIAFDVVIGNDLLSLTQREADIALRATLSPPENLVGRRVGTLRTAIYGARSYLDTLEGGQDPERYVWVAADASLRHVASHRWIEQHVRAEQVAFRYNSLGMVHDAVLAGQGVGLLACPLADRCEALVRLGEPLAELESPVWVLTHPDLRGVPRIGIVMNRLAQYFLADPRFR